MTQGKYVELSVAQRTDVWRRWKAGESLHRIGRAFDRPHTSIHCLLSHHGGIAPAVRRMRVSHETIYRSLFIQARGVLKKELIGHLRSKRRIRRSQHSRVPQDSRGQIVDAISIRERPAEIEDRAVPGHWEGDLIGGTKTVTSRRWWSDIRVLLPCSRCQAKTRLRLSPH